MKTKIMYLLAGGFLASAFLFTSNVWAAVTPPRVNSFQAVYAEIDKILGRLDAVEASAGGAAANKPLHVYDANNQDMGVMVSGDPTSSDTSSPFSTKLGDLYIHFTIDQSTHSVSFAQGQVHYFALGNCQGQAYGQQTSFPNVVTKFGAQFFKSTNSTSAIQALSLQKENGTCENRGDLSVVATQVQPIASPFITSIGLPLQVK